MKRKLITFIILAAVLLPVHIFAVSGITNIIVTPPNPLPGSVATIQWDYTATGNGVDFFVLISSSTTAQKAGTTDQWLVIGNGCVTPPTPATDTCNPCCNILGSPAAGPHTAGPFTFTVPTDLVPGNSYQFIIGMNEWFLELQLWGVNPNPPGAVGVSAPAFIVPLPDGSASITKTVENSTARGGDFVLYTINYNVVNSDNFTITDVVPANCTLIKQSLGGTNTGTTPGSTLSWPIGAVSSAIKSNVWFIVQVDSAAPVTTINNTSSWTAVGHQFPNPPISGSSNTAALDVIAPITIVKSQIPLSPGTANTGDNVTYMVDFHSGGESFTSLDPFYTDPGAGFFKMSGGGTANPGTWTWIDTGGGDGYIKSGSQGNLSYPRYLKTSVTDFCFGEIQADLYIQDTGYADSLISFRDNGLADFAAFHYGVGLSADHNPGDIYIQKAEPFTPLVGNNSLTTKGNTWYTIKILVTDASGGANPVGSVSIQAKAWVRGTAEPGAWMISYIDKPPSAIPACGYVGFQGHPDNENYYDNLKIIKSNPSNAVVYDTLPLIITYGGGTAADATHSGATNSGGLVSWNIFTSFTDQAYSLTWWGTVSGCGDVYNKFSYKSVEFGPVDSNSTTLNMTCNSPTFTPTWTDTGTPPPTKTFTPTFTLTATPTYTATKTVTPTITMTNTPIQYPTIGLTKSVNVALPPSPGDTIIYTINYSNSGPVAATNLSIIDALDNNLIYVAGSATAPGTHNGVNPGGQVSWIIPSVAAYTGTGSVSFSAVISPNVLKGTIITNQASSTCLESSTPVVSNSVDLNLNIPDLILSPVVTVPNPASTDAEIIFNLTVAAQVRMKFYTISGELIRTMDSAEVITNLMHGQASIRGGVGVNGNNSVKWDCKNNKNQAVASGIYFYRVEAVSTAGEKAFFISKLAVLR